MDDVIEALVNAISNEAPQFTDAGRIEDEPAIGFEYHGELYFATITRA